MTIAARRICAQCFYHLTLRLPRPGPHRLPSWRISPQQPLRSFSHSSLRGAFAPPTPASLGKAVPARQFKRTRKWMHRLAYLFLGGTVVYVVDKRFYASSLTRSVRTFTTGLVAALDYKINFREDPWFANDIAEVHARNATRLFHLLRTNGGLYLKIGQAIAMQTAILPPEFQKMFSKMFDDAPQNDWEDVRRVIMEDFGGRTPEEVFGISFDGDPDAGVMERKARASASVAQVHWARLKDGREVAVKIQKREIAQQVGWDLWAFKVVTRIYTWWFDLPLYSLVPYITERLQLECDFESEANNSKRMAELIKGEPRLRDRVYIPKIYDDLTTKRVMTAEWVEGVRLWDKESIIRPWQGGWRTGSPGAHGTPLDPPQTPITTLQEKARSYNEELKPDRTWWKGLNGKGGLGLDLKEVMTTMVDLFSAQMFLWGTVHCDPHPGNIFVRRLPNGHSELVLIDHGLYINMSPSFRHQYSLFWKSIMTFDNKTLKEVVSQWGINNAEIFASATLMRPYEGGDRSVTTRLKGISEHEKKRRQYELQQAMRKGIKEILADESKWPRELIFIGRNMRIVQGNNQYLGSPVNRIKITGNWASRALSEDQQLTFVERWRFFGSHLMFKLVLWASDAFFWYAKLKQALGKGKGMDDDVDQLMRGMAKDYGIEINHSVFEG
ncbi:Atypical/ABC1 protein kinase [Cladophialophora psammophila CBS 110553]|uniref:Atypical/ABC1 protein kinase n=1 Tax=Cladophialophora psammophila CBS 110553 TaxID=1182543 RepID=W9X073_9EURO|nr:Atypical/ABC1 protein kinase [Cladophialophora psammophila CBS 110553]EXJ70326.1 Atypical/ABC1 protein kinase [Cladophialophora psammophila CBS 110553]